MKTKRDITIYDIAKHLSVSAATVSRALKKHSTVKKATREQVIKAAKELGYQKNVFARSLRMQRTYTIGFLVHELNSNFITSVLAGVEKVTTQAGYDLIIAHSSESAEQEAANALSLFHKRVDGLIASLAFDTTRYDHFQPFYEKGIPVNFFDRVKQNGQSSTVVIDNYKAGYNATKHLIEEGCKRIMIITASLKRNVYADRFSGYRDALQDYGLKFDEKMLIVNDLSEKAGIESAYYILKMNPRPDGLFVTNDFVAAVCMSVLKDNGMKVPADIAIVGFNNDAIAKLVEPNLTTIDYPGMQMGEMAAKNLIDRINGHSEEQKIDIIIPSELIIRNSSQRKQATKS